MSVGRPIGWAPLPADAVVITSPRVARALARGLDLVVAEQRRSGAPLPAEVFAPLGEGLRTLASSELRFHPEPAGTRGDAQSLDHLGSEPRSWRCVRAVALELGVSDRYVRRVAGVELEGRGFARRRPDGSWEIDERGVDLMKARRRAAP